MHLISLFKLFCRAITFISFAMASLLESVAQFSLRAREFRLSEDSLRKLKRAGLDTCGILAYAHGQPGQQIDDDKFEQWLGTKIDPNINLADVAAIKRLLFEAQALTLAALKEQITSQDSTSVKRIPAAERETRMEGIKRRLVGILIEGPLEPSHSLLDLCANMASKNEVVYIPPEKCVSRTHEVLHAKSPAKQIEVSSDSLVLKESSEVPEGPVQSALQVQEALTRRGLGLVFADLIEHERYCKYLTTLFSHLHREPPLGYNRCTVSQLIAADKAVWQVILEAGVRPRRTEAGTLPLNDRLLEALQSYQVSFVLLPLASKKESAHKEKKEKKESAHKEKKIKTDKWDKPPKGKGKGKVPHQIMKLGGVGKNPDGENICYSYNCSQCNGAPDGGRCKKGLHICAKCFGKHSIQDHESSA